jgi:hypothetical protein
MQFHTKKDVDKEYNKILKKMALSKQKQMGNKPDPDFVRKMIYLQGAYDMMEWIFKIGGTAPSSKNINDL